MATGTVNTEAWKALRLARGLTLRGLAGECHQLGAPVSHVHLHNVETGRRPVSMKIVDAVATALGVSPGALVHDLKGAPAVGDGGGSRGSREDKSIDRPERKGRERGEST